MYSYGSWFAKFILEEDQRARGKHLEAPPTLFSYSPIAWVSLGKLTPPNFSHLHREIFSRKARRYVLSFAIYLLGK